MSTRGDTDGSPGDPACAWPRRCDCPAEPAGDGRASVAALSVVLPLRPRGGSVDGTPLFCLAGEAVLAWSFAALLAHLDPDVPVYGLQPPLAESDGAPPRTVRDGAARYVAEIRWVAPHGPYQLVGWSAGGFVAHEIARVLRASGEEVRLVVLGADPGRPGVVAESGSTAGELVAGFGSVFGTGPGTGGHTADETAALVVSALAGTIDLTGADLDRIAAAAGAAAQMTAGHEPAILPGAMTVVVAGRAPRVDPAAVRRNWRSYADGAVTAIVLDATHDELLDPVCMPAIAEALATVESPVRSAR
ncbi:thioesterase domain-containing protein [Nocardia asteroides]|uniref:thioesterase domain-containing protein n=1 Tax=Nocardia asteroides TaxID=1824 RepID=UPI001E4B4826|nr:thioesterase domain-containing protein [Nocardia asteroides]UGT56824.1 thioesterase domain-containing protein [Nocardia asteroides]